MEPTTNCTQCGGEIGGHEPVVTVGQGRPPAPAAPAARRYHLECWLIEARPREIADGPPSPVSAPQVAALVAAARAA